MRRYGPIPKPLRQRLPDNHVVDANGCWIWQLGLDKDGYGIIVWKGKNRKAHRMSMKVFNGSLDPALCVMHKCDNPSCINPKHLVQGTLDDNVADAHRKGRMHGKLVKKLTSDEVALAKALHARGWQPRELSRRFGADERTMFGLLSGHAWKSVAPAALPPQTEREILLERLDYEPRAAKRPKQWKRPWTKAEDRLVLTSTLPRKQLSKEMGRTTYSIDQRRTQLRHNRTWKRTRYLVGDQT